MSLQETKQSFHVLGAYSLAVLVFASLVFPANLPAQTLLGRGRLYTGLSMELNTVEGVWSYTRYDFSNGSAGAVPVEHDTIFREQKPLFGFELRHNQPLIAFGENGLFCLGNTFQPGFGLLFGELGIHYSLTLADFVVLRYGAGARRDSARNFGVGIGLGGQWTAAQIVARNNPVDTKVGPQAYERVYPVLQTSFFRPAMTVDLYFAGRLGIRVSVPFGRFRKPGVDPAIPEMDSGYAWWRNWSAGVFFWGF